MVRKEVFTAHCKAQGHDGINVLPCVEKYVQGIVDKVMFLFPQLAEFVRTGNAPMVEYMKERYTKATCKIPIASEIQGIRY